MADSKELKPKSFRIDDETAEKFKEISSAIGGNQQETLAKLIEAFEFQSGKAILTDKKEDIETFEKYITILTRMYMGSLEDNQNITETVKTGFDALLKSKDTTIQDLQEKITVSKQLKEEATSRAKNLTDENNNLINKLSEMEKKSNSDKLTFANTLQDKDNLNRALTDSCNDLKSKLEDIHIEYKELKEKANILDKAIAERDTLAKDKADLEKTLQAELNKYNKSIDDLKLHEADVLEQQKQKTQFELDRVSLELEKKYQSQIQSIKADGLELEKKYQEQIQSVKEDRQREVDKYQQKYYELLESMKNGNEVTAKKSLK